jgi:hypothetical protein
MLSARPDTGGSGLQVAISLWHPTLQQRRHLLGRLVAHLDTASIAEILVRLVGAEEQTGMYLPPSQVHPLHRRPMYNLLLVTPWQIGMYLPHA